MTNLFQLKKNLSTIIVIKISIIKFMLCNDVYDIIHLSKNIISIKQDIKYGTYKLLQLMLVEYPTRWIKMSGNFYPGNQCWASIKNSPGYHLGIIGYPNLNPSEHLPKWYPFYYPNHLFSCWDPTNENQECWGPMTTWSFSILRTPGGGEIS
jgi:hypothetical protein